MLSLRRVLVAARSSPLSRVQVNEVVEEIKKYQIDLWCIPYWIQVEGDRDKNSSLKNREKSDFFTKELDALLLTKFCDMTVHSAKDLPDPLPKGISMAALTRGKSPYDAILVKEGIHCWKSLPEGSRVGTSSERRERFFKEKAPGLKCVDIRGTIHERIELLDRGEIEALIVAEAALERLQIERKYQRLEEMPCALGQGQLAILVREEDSPLKELLKPLDIRKSSCA